MRVSYWQAASQTIEAPGLRVLCDPWFGYGDGAGGGNYDGSWGPSEPLPDLPNLLAHIGPVDYIYVSHLHPDHYAPEFLRAYLTCYPEARLLVSDEPMFQAALKRDGFTDVETTVVPGMVRASGVDKGTIRIVRHPVDTIDSALVVTSGDYAVVHLNDCRYNEAQVAQIKALVDGRALTAFLPYLGAGEWPQTYEMSPFDYIHQAERKRLAFRDMFCRYVDALYPSYAIPCAGESEYIGPLAALNPLRGLPSTKEAALWRLQGHAMEYGETLDLVRGQTVREPLPPWEPVIARPFVGYRYERDFVGIDADRLERLLPGLAVKAAHNLLARATLPKPYWLAVGTARRCHVAVDLSGRWGVRPWMAWGMVPKLGEPREEMEVDPRALFAVLTGLTNWNTLMGGAHVHGRRTPLSAYEEAIYYRLLPHFHV